MTTDSSPAASGTATTAGPTSGPLTSSLYRLVEAKLGDGQSPIEFIEARRVVQSEGDQPTAFSRIANEMSLLTGVYVSHEAVRRWYLAAHPEKADQSE